jgi:hypothetical protein
LGEIDPAAGKIDEKNVGFDQNLLGKSTQN